MKLELVDPSSPRVETVWRALEERARPVYFLTWAWMENWLACLPREEAPQLAVIERDGEPIAACFLRRRRLRRYGVVRSRALYLNATGLDAYDELCAEHNSMLASDGVSIASLISLLPGAWDELFLRCLDAAAFDQLAAAQLPSELHLRIDREVGDHYVDLAKVREKGYLPLLGSSTRASMRKAQRLATDAVFEVARDERQALDIYDELVTLHQRAWSTKGHPGAFADPWIDRFHRRLIAQRFKHGEIQLVRLRNTAGTIGTLYNFVSSGRVLFYQSGLGTPADRALKPGFLTHLYAVEHCAAEGHASYDFLGGDAQYKKSLATDETRLVWARVQRKHIVFTLEDRARQLRNRIRDELRARRAAAAAPTASPGLPSERDRSSS